MAVAEKQVALVPVDEIAEPKALTMFERLAADPNVPVEKLEKLIAMQERIMRINAENAFNVAFAQMQPEIPTIAERSKADKATYAPREDIVDVVRPILSRHGFSLNFKTEWPGDNKVRIIGILKHIAGHSETSEFLSGADQTGSKNAIQALGSAVEYGRRYTTTDLLNIATRKADDDGAAAGQKPKPEVKAPAGFEDWWTDMAACADNGIKALEEAWTRSKPEYRKHVIATNKPVWESLKRKAAAVQA